MANKQIIFAIITFLHNLFTVIWIGGLVTLTFTILPVSKKTFGIEQTGKLMDNIQKKLSILVYISIIILTITGILMSKKANSFTGFFSFNNSYSTILSIKHFFTILMVLIAIFRSNFLSKLSIHKKIKQKLSLLLLISNTLIGIVILFLSALLAALNNPPIH